MTVCDLGSLDVAVVLGEQNGIFTEVCSGLLRELENKVRLRHISSEAGLKSELQQDPGQKAVLLFIDEYLMQPEQLPVQKLVNSYVRRGGSVLMTGILNTMTAPGAMDSFFKIMGVPWRFGPYHRTDHAVCGRLQGFFADVPLDPVYSSKAVQLIGVREADRVFKPAAYPETYFDENATMAALAPVGKGWLGYTGDVNSEQGTDKLVLALVQYCCSNKPAVN